MTPGGEGISVLEDALLSILACPVDKGALLYVVDEALLYNPRLRRAYKIEHGLPVLLPGQSVPVPDDQHEYIVERAARGEVTATCGASAERVATGISCSLTGNPA
jgi:uncharacterized protein YbaR (Trm112 family)